MAGSKTQRIADELRAAIAAGQYAPGDRLPTQAELEERYGVAGLTARGAIAILRDQYGMAEGRQGSGTYVTPRRRWKRPRPPEDG